MKRGTRPPRCGESKVSWCRTTKQRGSVLARVYSSSYKSPFAPIQTKIFTRNSLKFQNMIVCLNQAYSELALNTKRMAADCVSHQKVIYRGLIETQRLSFVHHWFPVELNFKNFLQTITNLSIIIKSWQNIYIIKLTYLKCFNSFRRSFEYRPINSNQTR